MILRLQLNNDVVNHAYDAMYKYIEHNSSKLKISHSTASSITAKFNNAEIEISNINGANMQLIKKICIISLRDKLFKFVCNDFHDLTTLGDIQLKNNYAIITWNIQEHSNVQTMITFDDITIALVSSNKVDLRNLSFFKIQIEQTLKMLTMHINEQLQQN